jgi:hypothetical protein
MQAYEVPLARRHASSTAATTIAVGGGFLATGTEKGEVCSQLG